MDGGNFTNYGWCPPDYSPLEKMLFGWLTPEELTGPTTIKDMKPQIDGGPVYDRNMSYIGKDANNTVFPASRGCECRNGCYSMFQTGQEHSVSVTPVGMMWSP